MLSSFYSWLPLIAFFRVAAFLSCCRTPCFRGNSLPMATNSFTEAMTLSFFCILLFLQPTRRPSPCQEKWSFPGEFSLISSWSPNCILAVAYCTFLIFIFLLSSWNFLHYYRGKAVEAGRTELRWDTEISGSVLVSCFMYFFRTNAWTQNPFFLKSL